LVESLAHGGFPTIQAGHERPLRHGPTTTAPGRDEQQADGAGAAHVPGHDAIFLDADDPLDGLADGWLMIIHHGRLPRHEGYGPRRAPASTGREPHGCRPRPHTTGSFWRSAGRAAGTTNRSDLTGDRSRHSP